MHTNKAAKQRKSDDRKKKIESDYTTLHAVCFTGAYLHRDRLSIKEQASLFSLSACFFFHPSTREVETICIDQKQPPTLIPLQTNYKTKDFYCYDCFMILYAVLTGNEFLSALMQLRQFFENMNLNQLCIRPTFLLKYNQSVELMSLPDKKGNFHSDSIPAVNFNFE